MLQPELKFRRDKIRYLMAQQGIDAALIACNVNLLYTYGEICLLYTSPSPRDGLLSRMPSSA